MKAGQQSLNEKKYMSDGPAISCIDLRLHRFPQLLGRHPGTEQGLEAGDEAAGCRGRVLIEGLLVQP